MKILRNFVLVLIIVLGVGLCFNPVEKVHAASGVGTVKNIKKSKVKYADGTRINGKICYGYYRNISWKKVKGAKGYVVYRYDDLLNEWNKILTTKTNSFIISSLLQDETFTIKICAYKKSSVGKVYGDYSKDFKYKEYERLNLRSKNKVFLKGCYAEGKNNYFEYASKQAFIIQNKYRAEKGISPLIWSNELYNVSKIRAKEIKKLYSHTRPNSKDCSSIIEEYFGKERCLMFKSYFESNNTVASYDQATGLYSTHKKIFLASNSYSENIGCGVYGPFIKMERWKASPGHYSNILNSNFVTGAISCYCNNEQEYWTSSFEIINIDEIR